MTDVVIHTEPLPDAYRWDPANPVTGTNKFYVRTAEEMAKQGLVSVVYDGPAKYHNGVMYIPRGTDALDRERVVIDCNVDRPRHGSRARFQWTSFYNRPDVCVGEGYDRLFLVSDFVWSTLAPFVKAPVSVVELGCDFEVVEDPKLSARGKFCCYTSAPDRGLGFLQSIWPEVFKATGYELLTTPYGAGADEGRVRAVLDASRFWVYPATGTDSILSTLEAQARGCMPIYVPHMALPMTCRYGIQTDLHRFEETLITVLGTVDDIALAQFTGERRNALAARPIPTWSNVAQEILKHV